jgi:hypothetical protein
MGRKDIEGSLAVLRGNSHYLEQQIKECVELVKCTYIKYKSALPLEKRDLLKNVTSNRSLEGKSVGITLEFPFNEIAKRVENPYGSPYRDIPRTWDALILRLKAHFNEKAALAFQQE